ncbi:MAG: cyclase family protein [Desulfarculus sp.]|nr:cyclase family protein [Desulfarculus sp.]
MIASAPPQRLWDISLCLGREEAAYPGDPPFVRQVLAHPERGDAYELASLSLSAHAGTHLDAPAHFIPGGARLEDFPLERFLPPALVLEAPGAGALPASLLAGLAPRPGWAILFKTANSQRGHAAGGRWRDDYVHLSPALARACLDWGASLVGLDAPSPDASGDAGYPVHRLLLEAGVLLLEGLNLAGVPAGDYRLICPPLSLAGAEAAPVRALLWGSREPGAGERLWQKIHGRG